MMIDDQTHENFLQLSGFLDRLANETTQNQTQNTTTKETTEVKTEQPQSSSN